MENEYNIISKPKHYNRKKGIECIEEMIEVFGIEAVKNFCLCNIWKYRYRAADKNGEEDLDKSDWYMQKYIELQKRDKEKNDESTIIFPPQYINTPCTPNIVPCDKKDPYTSPIYETKGPWLSPPYEFTCNTNSVKTD